ncbi:MAG: hypothetical protein V4656_02440 [Pseudomonadota bacterium]
MAIDPTAFGGAADILAGLLGLLLAGVLPSMAITATALRSGGLRVDQIRRYAAGLRLQMGFWVGLFLLGLLAGLGLVVGASVNWSIETYRFPALPAFVPENGARFVVAWIVACLVLLIARLPAFYAALTSLVDLAETSAVSEAQLRDTPKRDDVSRQVDAIQTPDGFGRQVELKKRA